MASHQIRNRMNKLLLSLLCISFGTLQASESHKVCVTKVIIPAAGLGTRLLPFTKAVPKEMIPILNKPAIHHIIQEGIQSKIEDFIIITNPNTKNAVHDYFAYDPVLQKKLIKRGKKNYVSEINEIIVSTSFTYIPQDNPKGFGDAIYRARNLIKDEFFGVMLPDDIISGNEPGLAQLIRVAKQENATVIAVKEVPREKTYAYGIVDGTDMGNGLFRVKSLVEKPFPEDAPPNLAILGRYVFSPKLFDAIETVAQTAEGEVGVTEAIQLMIDRGEKVIAYKIKGDRYDVGNPMGWLEGVIGLALKDPRYGEQAKKIVAKFNYIIKNPRLN